MPSALRLAGIALLTVANMLFIVLPLALIARHALDDQPDEGWGYGWILLWPMLMLGFGVALINIIVVIRYLWKGNPTGLGRVLGSAVLAVSVVLVGGGLWAFIDMRAESRDDMARREARQAAKESRVDYQDITREHAERLLRLCTINTFHYTGQTDAATGNGGELARTGIMLTLVGRDPDRLSIADEWIDELVPRAHRAQERCGSGKPAIWHHGSYEG